MKTLSILRRRPSIEILIPAAISAPVPGPIGKLVMSAARTWFGRSIVLLRNR